MKLSTTNKQSDTNNTEKEVIQNTVIEEEKEDLSSLTYDEKIVYWKNKYKRIFKTEIDNVTYIWRRIRRNEYSEIACTNYDTNNKKDIYEKQFMFCKKCVLLPDNIEEEMNDSAGLAPTLSDEILFKSGFGDIYPKTDEV